MSDRQNTQLVAESNVYRGRQMVSEQEGQVAKIAAAGGDPRGAEGLLAAYRRSLAVVEDDLRHLRLANLGLLPMPHETV